MRGDDKWNEILKGTERKLVELLLTESVLVSKTIEDNFEEKVKEAYPKNFRSIRNQIKQQSKEVVTTLEKRRRKKWLNIKNKNRSAFKRTLVKETREHGSSDRFKNVTCERDRKRKLKEKSLKLSTKDTRPFPPEASTCKSSHLEMIKLLQTLAVKNAKTKMYKRVMLVLQDGRKKFINQYRRKMTN